MTLTSAVASGPHADCTRPVPREWCKHATAVARAAAEHAWSASIPTPSRLATASNAELAEIISELQRRVPHVGPALATLEFGKPSLDKGVAQAIASAHEVSQSIRTEDGAARAAEKWEYALHAADSAAAVSPHSSPSLGNCSCLATTSPRPTPPSTTLRARG